eukprot:1051242-Pleurochrysis_carterae.AAC.2
MSRQFWQSTFPKATNTFKGILKLCKILDWNNPPEKNTDTGNYAESIAEEAAHYYTHLYKAAPPPMEEHDARNKLYKLLEEGNGVDYSTSKEEGQPITTIEINKTMSNLPDSKSPGPDRIPNEFYKTFATLLAPLFCDHYNSFKSNGLPKGFADGIISILYKKGIREDIRNYRPITLLNTDCKILTRIIAKRTLTPATHFVSEQQIGFVPHTFIAEATMLIQMIHAHLDNENKEGLLVFLDLEKAFDRCSWSYLRMALRKLRFHESYCRWIDLLYAMIIIALRGKLSRTAT